MVTDIFDRHGCDPRLIADLGCGTGSFCLEIAGRGYDMIGIDISAEMLSCAKHKAVDASAGILFLNQDITSFELHGTVGAITSLMDSINYITYKMTSSGCSGWYEITWIRADSLFSISIHPTSSKISCHTMYSARPPRISHISGRIVSTEGRGCADSTSPFSRKRASITEDSMRPIMREVTISVNWS